MKANIFLKKLFFVVLLAFFLLPITVLAETAKAQTPIITINDLMGAITPLIILLATFIIRKIKPTLVGWNIVWVVVPVLNLIATAILVMIDEATSFLSQFLWNFLSVFVAQLVIQLTEAKILQNKKDKAALSK